MAPLSCTFLSVPASSAGAMSPLAAGGAVRSTPLVSSAKAEKAVSVRSPAASARILFMAGSFSCRHLSHRNCPSKRARNARAPGVCLATARPRSGMDGQRHRTAFRNLVFRRPQIVFEFGDCRRRKRIADHIGRAAAHVEELIDAEDEKQARLGNAELLQRRKNHHQ